MELAIYLIGLSLALGGTGLALFLWALRSGQYEDLDGAAQRILFDDPPPPARPRRDQGLTPLGTSSDE
jgi:cbb3-type cytochrome oxidase maturation protein